MTQQGLSNTSSNAIENNKAANEETNSFEAHLKSLPQFSHFLSFFISLSDAAPSIKSIHDIVESGDDEEASSKYWVHKETQNKRFLRKINQKLPSTKSSESDDEDDMAIDEEQAEKEPAAATAAKEEQTTSSAAKKKTSQKSEAKSKDENFVFSAFKTKNVSGEVIVSGINKKRKERPSNASTEKMLKQKLKKKQKLIKQSETDPEAATTQYTVDLLESAALKSESGRDNTSVKVLQNKLKKEKMKKNKSKKEWEDRVKTLNQQQKERVKTRNDNIKARKVKSMQDPLAVESKSAEEKNEKNVKKNRPGFEGRRKKVINGASKLKKLQSPKKN